MTGYIYAMVSGDKCKIGWSSNPRARVSKVRSDTPADVRLVGYIPGTIEDECAIHTDLLEWRAFGEWFRLEGAVVEFVESVRGKGDALAQKTSPHPIVNYRLSKAIGQRELADAVNVSVVQISRVETGSRMPSFSLAQRISRVTGVPLHDLRPDIYQASEPTETAA